MKKLISAAMASAIVITSALSFAPVADAATRYSRADRERYVTNYCARHPGDRDCRDFRRNRHRWDDRRYHRWYRDRHDAGDAAAAIFGLAIGAIAAGAASDHRERCEERYRSYDWRSDTFLGNDGVRHRCRL